MPILSRLGASLLEKNNLRRTMIILLTQKKKFHAGADENQKINFHRPNLNVKCFQLHIVRAEKPKLNDYKFGSFFFFEFANNEGRSELFPNTLIWSGLNLGF